MRTYRGGVLLNPNGGVVDGANAVAATNAAAPGATPSINSDLTDLAIFTGLAAAITGITVTGTPKDGQNLHTALPDNGTARAIAWGSQFEASPAPLPTTTVINARLDTRFTWNS